MPTSYKIGLLTIGAIFVLAAVLPRTFRLFGKETPNVGAKIARVGVGLFGVLLIVGALIVRDTTRRAVLRTCPQTRPRTCLRTYPRKRAPISCNSLPWRFIRAVRPLIHLLRRTVQVLRKTR